MHYVPRAHLGGLYCACRTRVEVHPLFADAEQFGRAAQRSLNQGRFDYARLLGILMAKCVSGAHKKIVVGQISP